MHSQVPRELFEACPHLEECLLNSNTLSGELPATVRCCTGLRELDVHTNFLCGSVPCLQLQECKRLQLLNLMGQRGEAPLVVRKDDGQYAALLAALPAGCHAMWPGDEDSPESSAKQSETLDALQKGKERTEKRRGAEQHTQYSIAC